MVKQAALGKDFCFKDVRDQNSAAILNFRNCTVNIVNYDRRIVFKHVEMLLKCMINDEIQLRDLLDKNDEMKEAYGTSDFFDKYRDFLSLASEHMNVLAPISEALASILTQ